MGIRNGIVSVPPWYKLLFFLKKESISSGDFGNVTTFHIRLAGRFQRLSPLTGILVIELCQEASKVLREKEVSVPLRGFW